ncbi:uncharacterized protein [Littorina saxatilis]|uniref:Fibronectin type III domain-containing protein n=1 Tax=Littorina saxatilis TaxID=31220 RepID=A0AAN9ALM2_9CAEN
MVSISPILSALYRGYDNKTTNNGTTVTNGTALQSSAKVLHTIQPEEVVILGIIICMWVVAVLAFLKRWGSIRILQPIEPRYRHSPKNLENVTVVKRAQDSVIYKNYSRKMSVTMVARENRRLQRMHTVPIMSALPMIPMETGTTEM